MDKKQKEYFEFLKSGIENNNLYQEGRRPTFLNDKDIQQFIGERNAALAGISLENFNKLLKDTQKYKNNNSYKNCLDSYRRSYNKDERYKIKEPDDEDSSTSSILGSATSAVGSATSAVGSAVGYTASGLGSALGLKGGIKSLKIKRSARHKKSRSKSIKRRKSSKK